MTRGVGLCTLAGGVVVAVVRPDPVRLVGMAMVRWPASPDLRAHRRVLATARRRLGLPRWCEVAVVAGDGAAAISPALLASAGLVQSRVVGGAPEQSTVDALLPAGGGPAARLAIGAALGALAAFEPPEPTAAREIDDGEWQVVTVPAGPLAGWAVQPIGEHRV